MTEEHHTVLRFDPNSIRDHFCLDEYEEDWGATVTDEQIAEAIEEALDDPFGDNPFWHAYSALMSEILGRISDRATGSNND